MTGRVSYIKSEINLHMYTLSLASIVKLSKLGGRSGYKHNSAFTTDLDKRKRAANLRI